MNTITCHFILYVRDQTASTEFYRYVLYMNPSLDVPGMTEFKIGSQCVLGLMPETGIKRLLGDTIQDPEKTNGVSRAELYLLVTNPEDYLARARSLGAKSLSEFSRRDWGHEAGYILDPDGHVVAFAKSGIARE